MNEVIQKLDEMSRKYDVTAMLAMQECDFLRYFGAIYSELNSFFKTPNNSQWFNNPNHFDQQISFEIITKCHQLLKTALDHHIKNSQTIDKNSIHLFNEIRKILIDIIRRDLRIGDQQAKDFDAVDMDFKALRACGLTKPGSYSNSISRYSDSDGIKKAELQALDHLVIHIFFHV